MPNASELSFPTTPSKKTRYLCVRRWPQSGSPCSQSHRSGCLEFAVGQVARDDLARPAAAEERAVTSQDCVSWQVRKAP